MKRRSVPSTPALVDPATGRRMMRRPDLRGLWTPAPSGAPLTTDEIDYDEVIVHRSWRSFDSDRPGEVKYFMIEFSQRNPGGIWTSAVKAVRFVRLTRVPRYLRQAGAGGTAVAFSAQQDLLAALREQQVLFVNLIAKSPELPLVFAYGVQAVGSSVAEATEKVDRAYEVLCRQLDGTYQQLQYAPLSMQEGELVARYQSEWSNVAAARGRPMPQGAAMGSSGLLDGNRTDVEQANQQLESFIRGMSDRSFLLTLITVPLSPGEISVAWRNITQKLSEVRSEQSGTRSVNAGIALPLSLGSGDSTAHGDTHSRGLSVGSGTTDTVSHSMAHAVSSSVTDSTSHGTSNTHSTSLGTNESTTDTHGSNRGTSTSDSQSTGTTSTQGTTTTHGTSETATAGTSQSTATGTSESTASGTSSSTAIGTSQSDATGTSRSVASGSSRSVAVSDGSSASHSTSSGTSDGSSVGGGLLISGNQNTGTNSGESTGTSTNNSTTATAGSSQTATAGSSTTRSLGTSQTATAGVSETNTVGTSLTNTVGTSQSLATGTSHSVAESSSLASSATRTQGTGTSEGTSVSQGRTAGSSATTGDSTGTTSSYGRSVTGGTSDTTTEGTSRGVSQNQSLSDSFAVAMTRTASSTGSLGVVPSFGVSTSRNIENVGKRIVGDILEAQMRRYLEGIESGAFLYQMFLQTPDQATLAGGAGLLKSAFWGAKASDASARLPQPFHVDAELPADEADRIRAHAQLFTSYRKREPRVELIEPFAYSTYVTPSELAAFCHPPTAESIGLLAVHDSMPVLAMPHDRASREVHLGWLINGERAQVTDQGFGVDLSEILSHMLITGVSGSGKTTTLMRLLYEVSRVRRKIVTPPTATNPYPEEKVVPAGILAIDWMRNLRNLVQVVEPERFRFYSVARPELGAFRWNPLAVPDDSMDPADWLSLQADNFVASWNLGEFGRALVSELLDDLYRANRLADHVLRPEVRDAAGTLVADAVVLPALDPATLPAGAIVVGPDGTEIANVYTCPALSRTVGMTHLAVAVMAKVEEAATQEGARLYGTAMRDRIQSLYRRVQYYLPGSKMADMLAFDETLDERSCLGVTDLVDPDQGLVAVLETDGLDMAARRLVIGSVLLAVYRYGLHHGEGTFDHMATGPGTFVVLEESHELLGEKGEDEDVASASTRMALYSSLFRRARALGIRLVAVAQNPGDLDPSITSNTSTVFVHRCYDDADRKRVFSLLNWSNMINAQVREWRYLGEMPVGYCIARLDARTSWLESAPVQFLTDAPPFAKLTDAEMATWVARLTQP